MKFRKEIPAPTGFSIGIKMNSVEFQDEGLTNDDAAYIAEAVDVGFPTFRLGFVERVLVWVVNPEAYFRRLYSRSNVV